jgi:hypothetical protein
MTTPADNYALLLAAPSATEAEMAKNLLAAEGIPCLFHSQDRDFAELGSAVHLSVSRPAVFVPKAALEKAKALLDAAWGTDEEA